MPVMRAAVIPAPGAVWELREVPVPQPGHGEVLVRVHACGVCFNDILATRGVIPFPSGEPAVAGHEGVGEIVEIGLGVTARKTGDRVGVPWVQATCGRCEYCQLGLPVTGQAAMNCAAPVTTGFSVPGAHAEYVVAVASGTVPLPDGLPYEIAAPMMCAGYTSWSALRRANPRPHERIAVLGIGGLGHLAVQLSSACGFETIAITRSDDKGALVRKLGADHVVANGEQLRELGGADVVLATGSSSATASDSIRGLRPNGRLVLAGMDSTDAFDLAPDPAKPFFAQGQQVLGASHDGPRYLREVLELAADGRCTPMIELFPAGAVADTVGKVADGAVRFRAVVDYRATSR